MFIMGCVCFGMSVVVKERGGYSKYWYEQWSWEPVRFPRLLQ